MAEETADPENNAKENANRTSWEKIAGNVDKLAGIFVSIMDHLILA